MALRVEITKGYPGFELQASFTDEGLRTGILGASGCGKSLTLKAIAGIERPDEGVIQLDGRTLFDSSAGIDLPPRQRAVGYLFQHYALFPSMSVEENIGVVARNSAKLKSSKNPSAGISTEAFVASLMDRFRLTELAKKKPAELSGGQQQRVALARIFAMESRAILLDEPFSALDSHLKTEMEGELQEALSWREGTTLFVSHDRDEVFRFCQRAVVLHEGRVSASGDIRSLFLQPGTVAAARLTGCKNVAPATASGSGAVYVPDWGLELRSSREMPVRFTHVGIRAHHIRVAGAADRVNRFEALSRAEVLDPFSAGERLFVSPPGRYTPSPKPLLRVASHPEGFFAPAETRGTYCVDPEHVLLLAGD